MSDENNIKTIFDAPSEDEQEPENCKMGDKCEEGDE